MGSTLDIINTFSSMASLDVPTDRKMDGYDLSKVLTDLDSSPRDNFYYWGFAELHAVRKNNLKLRCQPKRQNNLRNVGKTR